MNRIRPERRSHHTTINIPIRLYREAQDAQKERGFDTFNNLINHALRELLHGKDMENLERRIVRSQERIVERVERVAEANRAGFALNMALTRELLSERTPKWDLAQRMNRVIAAAVSDFSGQADQFFSANGSGLSEGEQPEAPFFSEPSPMDEEYEDEPTE